MQFSPAKRTKPTLLDGFLALITVVCAVGLLFLGKPDATGPLTATISLNGQVIDTILLDNIGTTTYYKVANAPYPITLELNPGTISVQHSDCPGQDCVHMGHIATAGSRLVCLPNRLLITISGGSSGDVPNILLG